MLLMYVPPYSISIFISPITFPDQALHPERQYVFRVRANNVLGHGPLSDPSDPVWTQGRPSLAPTPPKPLRCYVNTLDVGWDAVGVEVRPGRQRSHLVPSSLPSGDMSLLCGLVRSRCLGSLCFCARMQENDAPITGYILQWVVLPQGHSDEGEWRHLVRAHCRPTIRATCLASLVRGGSGSVVFVVCVAVMTVDVALLMVLVWQSRRP
jgi:hypothetical protein